MKEKIKNDIYNLKKVVGDAISVVSEVKVMKGVPPTISSGDHCIVTYLLSYQNKSISKERAIETIKKLLKNGYGSKEIAEYAESILGVKLRGEK